MSKDVRAVPTRLALVPSNEPDNRAPVGLHVKGRYRVVSELGTGVFGTVCLAVDEAHVVKRLHGSAEIDGDAQSSLDLEGPLRQDRAQSATVDELHRREGLTGFRLPEFQHSDQR